MIYLKFLDLSQEAKERLMSISREHVEHKFGKKLKDYAQQNCLDYDAILEEETVRNLYSYDYIFNI